MYLESFPPGYPYPSLVPNYSPCFRFSPGYLFNNEKKYPSFLPKTTSVSEEKRPSVVQKPCNGVPNLKKVEAGSGVNKERKESKGKILELSSPALCKIVDKNDKSDKSSNGLSSNEEEKQQEESENKQKFYTEFNSGYKCSCTKTQCNRYYCECYAQGRYCVDCNCKNCLNLPPSNACTNKRPGHSEPKKKELVTCTCTRSGCNKKYCECFKNGSKCSSACRCVGCENCEGSRKNARLLGVELANSICIVDNKIREEKVEKRRRAQEAKDEFETDFNLLSQKRKRDDSLYIEDMTTKNTESEKNSDSAHVSEGSIIEENNKQLSSFKSVEQLA